MRFALALGVVVVCCGAGAAELPSRSAKAKPAEAKARSCEIGLEQGVLLANGTCVRIGGYVNLGVGAGSVRH